MDIISKKITQANQFHEAGDLDQALSLYNEILRMDATQSEALHHLGIIAIQQKDVAKGLQYLQGAVASNPKDPQIHLHLGNVYKLLKKLDSAKKSYLAAIKLQPDYANAHYNLGAIYYAESDWKNALVEYQETLKLAPEHWAAQLNLGKTFFQNKAIDFAKQTWLKLIENNNCDDDSIRCETYQALADLALSDEDYLNAIKYYNLLLSIQPKNTDARHKIALSHLKRNENEEAIIHYSVLITDEPEHYEAHYNIATLLVAKNDLDSATYHFRQAIKHNPNMIDAYSNLGAIAVRQGRTSAAISLYKQVIKLDYNHKTANFILAALTQETTPEQPPDDYIKLLFDGYADHYDKHLMDDLEYAVPMLIDGLLEKFNIKLIPNILELGCGSGLTGNILRKYCEKLIGIDLSEEMLRIAKSKELYDELKPLNLLSALSQYKDMDLIIAADTFVYLGSLDEVFEKSIKYLSKPDGKLIFSTEMTTQENFTLQETGRYAHNENYIQNLAQQHGFKILEQKEVCLRKQNNEQVLGYLWVLSVK